VVTRTRGLLSGLRDSRPVRTDSGQYDWHQHDVWGMLLDSLRIHARKWRCDSAEDLGRHGPTSSIRRSRDSSVPKSRSAVWRQDLPHAAS
jgi:hypothetical protein